MSRGRGRGWAGRGRGIGGVDIRDDDGSYITKDLAAPPPLFPDLDAPDAPVRVPQRAELTADDEELKGHWRSCQMHWQNSPFNLQLPRALSTGVKRGLQDFAQQGLRTSAVDTKSIFKVITPSPKVFPAELISSLDKRISQRAASNAYFSDSLKTGKEGLPEDFLARLGEMKDVPVDAEAAKLKEAEKEDEEQAAEVDDLDDLNESEIEDDDYMQGVEYDDDEGYEEDIGGDGDNEAVF